MGDSHETDTGIVCRLANEHLGERLVSRNEVLSRLPREFRGSPDELAKGVQTNLDVNPVFKSTSSALAVVHQKIVAYQWKKEHHKPPSRLERLQGSDNFHAKRVACELLKCWAVANKDAEEEGLDEDEVRAYQDFVIHLLHYYDRWLGKYFASDAFCETLVGVHWKLQELKQVTISSERQYTKVLERIYEKSVDMCDHALRIAMLAVTDNHVEMEAFLQRKGPLSLRLIGQRSLRSNSTWWGTDYGQVLDAAIVRGDPARFRPVGCGLAASGAAPTPGAAASAGHGAAWTVWSHEHGLVKTYEFASGAEAEQQYESSGCCSILVGPAGKLRAKTGSSSAVMSKVFNEEQVMRELHQRVDRQTNLQRAAVGLGPLTQPPVAVPVPVATESALESLLLTPASVAAGGATPAAPASPATGSSAAAASEAVGAVAARVAPVVARSWSSLTGNLGAAVDSLRQASANRGINLGGGGRLGTAGTGGGGATGSGAQAASATAADAPPESRRRPELRDRVRIVVENEVGEREDPDRDGTMGRVGIIVEDDGSDQPYNVDLGDGKERWYKEHWVLLVEEAAEAAGDVTGEEGSRPETGTGPEEKAAPDSGTASCSSTQAEDVAAPQQPAATPSSAAAEGPAPDGGEATALGPDSAWDLEVEAVKARWMQGYLDASGLAEPFRGAKRVKWQEGMSESRQRAADMPSLILDVPKRLSDLLQCHTQVMGAVNGMTSKGGSKEALAAIFALRQRASITGHLTGRMDAFIAAASLVHGVAQRELFKCIEQGSRIKGQTPSAQRLYLDSFSACSRIRDGILTEWHQLGLKVTDATLAEEFKRIDASERDAYAQLMRLPVMLPALGDAPAPTPAPAVATGALPVAQALSLPGPPTPGMPLAVAVPLSATTAAPAIGAAGAEAGVCRITELSETEEEAVEEEAGLPDGI